MTSQLTAIVTIDDKRRYTHAMLKTIGDNQRHLVNNPSQKRRRNLPDCTTKAIVIYGDSDAEVAIAIEMDVAVLVTMADHESTTRLVVTETGEIGFDTPDSSDSFDVSAEQVKQFIDQTATDADIKQAYKTLKKHLSIWQQRHYA